MSSAYATLAAGGIRRRPTSIERVEFPDGKSENLGESKGKRVFTDGEAYEVTKILEQNVQSGTGTNANYGCPAAGKTGTTDEGKDAWFVGYTPKLSTSVWVGYPDAGVAIAGAQGGTLAAPVWNAFMSVAHGEDCSPFPQPKTAAVACPSTTASTSGSTGTGTGTYTAPGHAPYTPPAHDGRHGPLHRRWPARPGL